jgi:hypothetical protein
MEGMSLTLERLYADIQLVMCTDYARENRFGEIAIEQDADLMTKFVAPVKMVLDAGAVATEIAKPLGALAIRFVAVYGVDSATGVHVIFNDPGNDPVLVRPPDGVGKTGFMLLMTNVDTLYVANPSATGSVGFRLALGCS